MGASALLMMALALAPSQAPGLNVVNIRATHGLLGPSRQDANLQPNEVANITAGEALYVAFDITGLEVDKNTGRLRFTADLEVTDLATKKAVVTKDLGETRFFNMLGVQRVPHAVKLETGSDVKPGRYTLKVNFQDAVGKGKGGFSKDFVVKEPGFSLVRFQTSYDVALQLPAPAVGTVGQALFVNVVAIGYGRNADSKLADLTWEMSVQDGTGKAVSAKPLAGGYDKIPPAVDFLPIQFDLPLTQAGDFKLVITANDKVAKKMATLTVPFKVVEAPK